MTWSYSRIQSYHDCPYKFFITYIDPCGDEPLFFASYGKLIHELLASFFQRKKTRRELIADYLNHFRPGLLGKCMSHQVFQHYMRDGLNCLKSIQFPESYDILGVEKEIHFTVGPYPFIGYIDLLLRDQKTGDLIIVDHKSHSLKQRSGKKKPLKSDLELDEYLRQLYLYSIAVRQEYGNFPKKLVFHCYRTGLIISEDFVINDYEKTIQWAEQSIENILREEQWNPAPDLFYCKYICGQHQDCVYYDR